MSLGDYREGVPAKYLFPAEAFTSEEAFPRFPNAARRAGVDTFSLSGGALAEDFDFDGYLDLMVLS